MIETLYTIATFVVVLSVVVFVHEYGHYIVGRWCGIHAEVFSLGMGPRLGGWTDRHGTHWQVAAIPLGGYVKFLGDANAASAGPNGLSNVAVDDQGRTLLGAALWKRALTVAAGPIANFILSILIFAGLVFATGIVRNDLRLGEFATDPIDLRVGDEIVAYEGQPIEAFFEIYEFASGDDAEGPRNYTVLRDGRELDVRGPYPYPALVGFVQPLSAAANAGVQPGDLIIGFNGVAVQSFDNIRDLVRSGGAGEREMVILRDGQELSLTVKPEISDVLDENGEFVERVQLGIGAEPAFSLMTETPGFGEAAQFGVARTWMVITTSLDGIYHIIRGDLGADNLQGPIGIARASADTASSGLIDLIGWIGLISTAIGLMNLFPIPVLDGGHLVLYAYEAVRGRPPRERIANALTACGLSLLLTLMVFATYNDVLRLLNA
ncbi:MAG: RIP metalloprotease RseP [Pseudomonadota bacterium]